MSEKTNILNINIPYLLPKKAKDNPNQQTNQELTQDYLNFAVSKTYEKGLNGQLRRVDGRLKRKLQDAIDSGKDEIELTSEEIAHIRKCVVEAEIPTGLTFYFCQLEDEINKLI